MSATAARPAGEPREPSVRAARELRRRVERWRRELADVVAPREGAVVTSADQQYGPGTGGVRLVLDLAGSIDLVEWLRWLVPLEGGDDLIGDAVAELEAVARTAERARMLESAIVDLARRLAEKADACDGARAAPSTITQIVGDVAMRVCGASISAWMVADLVPDTTFRTGQAALLVGLEREWLEGGRPIPAGQAVVVEAAVRALQGWSPESEWEPGWDEDFGDDEDAWQRADDEREARREQWSEAGGRASMLVAVSGRAAARDRLIAHLPDPDDDWARVALDVSVACDLDSDLARLLPPGVPSPLTHARRAGMT